MSIGGGVALAVIGNHSASVSSVGVYPLTEQPVDHHRRQPRRSHLTTSLWIEESCRPAGHALHGASSEAAARSALTADKLRTNKAFGGLAALTWRAEHRPANGTITRRQAGGVWSMPC